MAENLGQVARARARVVGRTVGSTPQALPTRPTSGRAVLGPGRGMAARGLADLGCWILPVVPLECAAVHWTIFVV